MCDEVGTFSLFNLQTWNSVRVDNVTLVSIAAGEKDLQVPFHLTLPKANNGHGQILTYLVMLCFIVMVIISMVHMCVCVCVCAHVHACACGRPCSCVCVSMYVYLLFTPFLEPVSTSPLEVIRPSSHCVVQEAPVVACPSSIQPAAQQQFQPRCQ